MSIENAVILEVKDIGRKVMEEIEMKNIEDVEDIEDIEVIEDIEDIEDRFFFFKKYLFFFIRIIR